MKKGKLSLSLALLLLAFALACNSKTGGSGNVANKDGNSTQVEIVGAGSTFVYPLMTKWIEGFRQQNSGVRVNYQAVGSSRGIEQLQKGLVDFGASDVALDDKALKSTTSVLQIPESAGAVCITYNLPSLKQPLRLTPKALAGIFLGTIKTWQDPEIGRSNPGADFPSGAIVVARRTDGSGTTDMFTTYLSIVSQEWQKQAGKGMSVQWPVGLGGKGNEGVAGVVEQSLGAIGYVELTYALDNHMPVAEVQNAAGKFVAPSPKSASAAIAAFAIKIAADVRAPIVNPPASAPEAYPISGFTYLLVPADGARRGKAQRAEALYCLRRELWTAAGGRAALCSTSAIGD